MTEIWEMIREKVMHGLYACLIVAAVILLGTAVWRLAVHYWTQGRIASAKKIYNAIKLGEPPDSAFALFRGYSGSTDQYTEETLLPDGRREEVLCLLFGFGRGEMGEIRLTYVDRRLVQKHQNGIW